MEEQDLKQKIIIVFLCIKSVLLWAQEPNLLSFAVISDTHFENNAGYGAMTKVPKVLRNLTSHGNLDALAVVGDLTNNGEAGEYKLLAQVFGDKQNYHNPVDHLLFMIGNHDMLNQNGVSNYQDGLKEFNQGESYPLHTYQVIKGFPFITISQLNTAGEDFTDPNKGLYSYPDQTLDTLQLFLSRAARECPDKPIFIFTHVPPSYTCYGTWVELEGGDGWCMSRLNPILNNYPQAVVFCGHSHYALNDPRSIHQGVNPNSIRKNFYTVINAGTTSYSEINPGCLEIGTHPWKFDYITQGLMVNELENGDIEIRRYDTFHNEEIYPKQRWILKAPFDGSMFEYADIRDADDNPQNISLRDGLPGPFFSDEAKITVEPTDHSVKITIPQAIDNECVFRYGVRVFKDGSLVTEKFFSSQFYLNKEMPSNIVCTINGLLNEADYEIEVTAYDSYNNYSTPLSAHFMTTENTTPAPYEIWTFDNPENLMASSSHFTDMIPLEFKHTADGLSLKRQESPSDAGIVSIDGPTRDNKAIHVPVNSALEMLLYKENSNPDYTMMMDIRVEDALSFNALLQTSVNNQDDADCFIYNNTIGLSILGYGGNIESNRWYRIVFVYQDGVFNLFVDGELIKTVSNDRWSIKSYGCCLLLDNDGERVKTDLAEVAYWDMALNESQIRKLGRAGIPTGFASVKDEGINNNNGVYDLSGRKVANEYNSYRHLPKGICIYNGKKCLVK